MDIAHSHLQSLHFLVAEADPVQRRALIEALGQVGATRVTDVPDGPMALRTLQASFTPKVDVAVIDLDLGGMDGLELLRAIAALQSTVRLIIVGAHPANVLFSVEATRRWAHDGITAKGVSWDITGLSYYCMWHGSLSNLYNVIVDVKSRYSKPVVIAETAYPFTSANADREGNAIGSQTCDGQPQSWTGQATEFSWVQNTARNAGAIGVFYWEPTWYAISGNGWDPANMNGTGDQWDNMAIFNWTGHVNPSVVWTP